MIAEAARLTLPSERSVSVPLSAARDRSMLSAASSTAEPPASMPAPAATRFAESVSRPAARLAAVGRHAGRRGRAVGQIDAAPARGDGDVAGRGGERPGIEPHPRAPRKARRRLSE